jgi:exopolysaccharide biosynthesis polyprenyl glycosylphosphotransferase
LALSIDRFASTPAAKLGLGLDLSVLAAAVVLATSGPWWLRAAWVLCSMGVFWSTSSVARHYGSTVDRARWEDVLLSLVILLSVVTVVSVGGWLLDLPSPRLDRLLMIAFPVQALLRVTVFAFVRAQTAEPRQVLIVGTGPLGRITGEDLVRARAVCKYLSWPGESIPEPLRGRYLGEAGELASVLHHEVVDEIYLCGLAHTQGRWLQAAVSVCETYGVPFALPAYSVRLGRAHPVANKAVADGFLHYVAGGARPEYRVLKRLLDVIGSAAALWLLFPFLLLISALVRLTSKGPVFFRQIRVGLHGKEFHMLKFRSMIANAEDLQAQLAGQNEQSGPVFKMKRDPRVTPLGRLLRRYSIDELPQLVNVLRGDMTLVGPRPPVPQEVAQYEPWQCRRLSVPPGLTCFWQVSGRNEIAFQDWMYLDLQYIDHQNLGDDLNLLLKTVPAVWSGRGSH